MVALFSSHSNYIFKRRSATTEDINSFIYLKKSVNQNTLIYNLIHA